MISDVLSDAVDSIMDYLAHNRHAYAGAIEDRVLALLDQMDAVRELLDAPPSSQAFEDYAVVRHIPCDEPREYAVNATVVTDGQGGPRHG